MNSQESFLLIIYIYPVASLEKTNLKADRLSRSEYNSILFSLVNERLTNHRTVCYTSNISLKDMETSGIDRRITDRFKEMISGDYMLEGEAKRA